MRNWTFQGLTPPPAALTCMYTRPGSRLRQGKPSDIWASLEPEGLPLTCTPHPLVGFGRWQAQAQCLGPAWHSPAPSTHVAAEPGPLTQFCPVRSPCLQSKNARLELWKGPPMWPHRASHACFCPELNSWNWPWLRTFDSNWIMFRKWQLKTECWIGGRGTNKTPTCPSMVPRRALCTISQADGRICTAPSHFFPVRVMGLVLQAEEPQHHEQPWH